MWVEGGLKEWIEMFFSNPEYVLKAYSDKQRENGVNQLDSLK